jgi:hypothetical protein
VDDDVGYMPSWLFLPQLQSQENILQFLQSIVILENVSSATWFEPLYWYTDSFARRGFVVLAVDI